MSIRLEVIPPTPGAAELFAALAGCERPWIAELSVKAIGGRLRRGRFLLSMPRSALGPGPRRVLQDICRQMNVPADGFAVLDVHQSRAHAVHFALEPEDRGKTLVKCYLEFAPGDEPAPDVVFLALKWCWQTPEIWSLSRYMTRDALGSEEQLALALDILPAGRSRDCFVALMASAPEGTDGLRLLEVQEPGTPRRSLDLNLSACDLTLGAAHTQLVELLGGAGGADAYLRIHESDRLGHIAAGVARDGQVFATVYHGAHRLWPERSHR